MDQVVLIVNNISRFILNPLILLMFACASIVFIWGAINFVGSADNAEARGKGARQMIWGILGMTIMVGARVLVDIISNTAKVL